jgi:hypothetical protein
VHFYVPFLEFIHNNEKTSRLAILAQSHIGHTPLGKAQVKFTSLHYQLTTQVQAHSEAVDALLDEFPLCKRLILIGHSVGSWICLQVRDLLRPPTMLLNLSKVARARPRSVSTAFLLFPTISNIRHTPNGRKLFVSLNFLLRIT